MKTQIRPRAAAIAAVWVSDEPLPSLYALINAQHPHAVAPIYLIIHFANVPLDSNPSIGIHYARKCLKGHDRSSKRLPGATVEGHFPLFPSERPY